jgi:hypothetical protein
VSWVLRVAILWFCFARFLAPAVAAQQTTAVLEKLLPPGAKIIEAADLTTIAKKPRVMALWIDRPVRESTGEWWCGTAAYGKEAYNGPLRLSLLDPASRKLINTLEIEAWGPGRLQIPALVSDGLYRVPRPDKNGDGVPEIMHLGDFTGEGLRAQFPLFMFEACGIFSGAVLGYQRQTDRVVWYRIQNRDGVSDSMEQVFAYKPVSPGHWDFNWEPRHGSDEVIHEEVTFDRKQQMFAEKRTVTQRAEGSK